MTIWADLVLKLGLPTVPSGTDLTRIVYMIVGVAAVWCIVLCFRLAGKR